MNTYSYMKTSELGHYVIIICIWMTPLVGAPIVNGAAFVVTRHYGFPSSGRHGEYNRPTIINILVSCCANQVVAKFKIVSFAKHKLTHGASVVGNKSVQSALGDQSCKNANCDCQESNTKVHKTN
eukprot:144387-Pleurochrysis_carterae.AAC.1